MKLFHAAAFFQEHLFGYQTDTEFFQLSTFLCSPNWYRFSRNTFLLFPATEQIPIFPETPFCEAQWSHFVVISVRPKSVWKLMLFFILFKSMVNFFDPFLRQPKSCDKKKNYVKIWGDMLKKAWFCRRAFAIIMWRL